MKNKLMLITVLVMASMNIMAMDGLAMGRMRELLNCENLNSGKRLYTEESRAAFELDLRELYLSQSKKEFDEFCLNAIMSFGIEDKNLTPEIMDDRAWVFAAIIRTNLIVKQDQEAFLKLARHLSRFELIPCDENLARTFSSDFGLRTSLRITEERRKYQKNQAILEYRKAIINACSLSLPIFRASLSAADYEKLIKVFIEEGKLDGFEEVSLKRLMLTDKEAQQELNKLWKEKQNRCR